MSNTTEVVATLAHIYTAAKDTAESLSDKPFMAARRLQEATTAQVAAEAIVMLTDSGDWRTRARRAKDDREKVLFVTSQLVAKGNKFDDLNVVAGRQFGGQPESPTLPADADPGFPLNRAM